MSNMKLTSLTHLNINKNIFINIAIILIALPIAINIHKFQLKNIKLLEEEKGIEIKKNEVLENIGQLEKIISSYKDYLNKKDISLVMNNLSNTAKGAGVNIISFRPHTPEDYPMYIKYSFDLVIGVDSYHALGKFISDLESSPDVYFVDKLTIRSTQKDRELAQTDTLIINLTLSTILLRS